ncbi:hypothetical protein TREES_T100007945 [Tupaia chinensis]|uniref:Uncharacterized protein n=1 Tax=Tupaia chinensis TaxID=246437 RepID=L9JB75_TUPCH|nr:hypothetical protein TREES_T100007945 [Tupaia chinensis]
MVPAQSSRSHWFLKVSPLRAQSGDSPLNSPSPFGVIQVGIETLVEAAAQKLSLRTTEQALDAGVIPSLAPTEIDAEEGKGRPSLQSSDASYRQAAVLSFAPATPYPFLVLE